MFKNEYYILIMENGKTQIRASSLNDYTDCSRRAAAKIIKREIIEAGFSLNNLRSGAPALVGTSAHKVMEYSLENKIHGNEPNWKDAQEIALETWVQESTKEELSWDNSTPNNSAAEKQIKAIGSIYFHEVAPLRDPVATELYFEAAVDQNFILTGHADDLERSGYVRDFKTGANDSNYLAQLGAYSLLARSNGYTVSGVGIDWVPRKKAGILPEFKEKNYDKGIAENVASQIINRIKNDVEQFKKTGNPWSFTANPSSMLCSNKFCPAWGTKFCDYTQGVNNKKERL